MVAEPGCIFINGVAGLAAMGDSYEEQIRILAEAMEHMQGRVLAAEQATATAERERRQIANRLVAAENEFRGTSSGSAPRGIPMNSPRATAEAPRMPQLVDTRNIGKVPNFSGEREAWGEWSFQFGAFLGAANPKATKALKWARAADR